MEYVKRSVLKLNSKTIAMKWLYQRIKSFAVSFKYLHFVSRGVPCVIRMSFHLLFFQMKNLLAICFNFSFKK